MSYIKKLFYEDENFSVTLEEADGLLMAHLAIFNFSKAVLKEIHDVWHEVQYRAYCQGYEQIYTYTTEDRMFKFFTGGNQVGQFERDGQNYKVWKWDLS